MRRKVLAEGEFADDKTWLPASIGAVGYELLRQPQNHNTLDEVDRLWFTLVEVLKKWGYPPANTLNESLCDCSLGVYKQAPAKFVSARDQAEGAFPTFARNMDSLFRGTIR